MARVIFIGLESAGKTAAFQNIIGRKNYMATHETVGINTSVINIRSSNCRSHGIPITLVDLGGSEKIRGMWSSQFFDTSGALYFVRDPASLDLAIQLLTNIFTTTSFPLHVLINSSDKDAASQIEISIKELFGTYSSSHPLLSCSICNIFVKYKKNKPLQEILQSLGVAAHRYYVTHCEEIVLQQKNALAKSFNLTLSVDERRQKLLELREQNNKTEAMEQVRVEPEENGGIQALTPAIFTAPA